MRRPINDRPPPQLPAASCMLPLERLHGASRRKEVRHVVHGPDHIGPIIAGLDPSWRWPFYAQTLSRERATSWPLLIVHQLVRAVARAKSVRKAAFGRSTRTRRRLPRLRRAMLCRRIFNVRSRGSSSSTRNGVGRARSSPHSMQFAGAGPGAIAGNGRFF